MIESGSTAGHLWFVCIADAHRDKARLHRAIAGLY